MAGKRSGLFFEIMRLVREIQPTFVFLENVSAIRTRGLDTVLKEFAKVRYDCRWTMLSASDVGALHKRERWFLLANSTSKSANRHAERKKEAHALLGNSSEDAADTMRQGFSDRQEKGSHKASEKSALREYWPYESRAVWQETVSSMGKCSDGVPNHVARLKALGNSVVPQQVKKAFQILMGLT